MRKYRRNVRNEEGSDKEHKGRANSSISDGLSEAVCEKLH